MNRVGTNGLDSNWTPAVEAEMVAHLTAGKSAAQIAVILNQKFAPAYFSRCSVVGRCYRRKIKMANRKKLHDEMAAAAIRKEKFSLNNSYPGTCLWPTGEGPYTFECCKKAVTNRPYCEGHMKRAYIPRKPLPPREAA